MAASSSGDGGQHMLRIGKYEVQAYIATGGMGAVYRALDVDLGRTVALKILQPELARKPKVVERFRREARSAARLNHENIVTVYEFAEVKGTYLLALEYVDGTDLHQYVTSRGRCAPDEACRLTIQAARALAHAHGQGIVHRDIKPSNFLLTQREGKQSVKLTDFGLARAMGEDEPLPVPLRAVSGPLHYVTRLTTLGSTVGTVDFMSPEQARDSGSADARSDIYSLGCTLFFMLTGNCPYPGGTPAEKLLKHVEQPVPNVRARNPAVPPGLAAILERMLAKSPRERYQTPLELLHDLGNVEHLNALPAGNVSIPVLQPVAIAPPPTLFAEKTPPTGELVLPRKRKAAAVKQRGVQRPKRAARRRKAKQSSGWLWLVAALGGLAITGSVVLVLTQHQFGTEPPPSDAPVIEAAGPDRPAPAPVPDPGPKDAFPIASLLPRLYTPAVPLDLAGLRQEYEGSLADRVSPVVGDAVFHVSRTPLGAPNTFRSLEEALARAPTDKPALIEIHDNGPLFVPSVPALVNRTVILRAGQGYRPLLAWDAAAASDAKWSNRFVGLERATLSLEDVDVVFKATGPSGGNPVLFQVDGGMFSAWNCSFSTAGSGSENVVLIRLGTLRASSNCRLRRCYARGGNLTAISVDGTGRESAEVLLEECLLVGNEQPLLRVVSRDDAWIKLRAARSTLVAGKALVRVDPAGMGATSPHVHCRVWDSLLTRGSQQVPGELLALGEGVRTEQMSWKAVNCLYAGWGNLLTRNSDKVAGTALEEWHKQWLYSLGDKALGTPWPDFAAAPLAQIPPISYQTAETPASYAASSHAGPLGCDVAVVPAASPSWLKRTYEPIDIPPVAKKREAAPKTEGTPDTYAGEKLDLSKTDLGKHLQTVLATRKPATRVVMELSGKSPRGSSPIRVRGFELVLVFSASPSKGEPPTLASSPVHSSEGDALIDVEDGSLEIIDGRLSMAGLKAAALPKHLIRVRGGDLRLSSCRLTGPLSQETGGFQSLIAFQGAGEEANDEPRGCTIADSVLQSSKNIINITGTAARVQVSNSVVLAGENALHFDFGGATPRLNLQCLLQHNTIAAHAAAFDVPDCPDVPGIATPLLIRADANVFADPFVDVPHKSSVLRFSGSPIPRGALLWQGKGNLYDQRLQALASRADGMEVAPALKDWQRLWGTPGEQQPAPLQWPAGAKATFSLELPRPERLALPPDVSARFGAAVPGADLMALNLVRK
jgi:eukaryotic-like serine/threonine-protein kinase